MSMKLYELINMRMSESSQSPVDCIELIRENRSDKTPRLSMMASLSIYAHGTNAPKCPWCGKFRRVEEFYDAHTSNTIYINSEPVHVDYGPLCKSCRDGKFDA